MLESEIAFVIVNKSVDIARDIAGITSIRGYKFEPKPRLRITDTYYDTKRCLLGKKKIGLRTRRAGGELLISMKSNPQRMAGMGLRRNEFESSWSYESLAKIVKALKIKGLPTRPFTSSFAPSRVMAKLGLKKIQERHTTRDVRDILGRDMPRNRRIAELDIDRVTFQGNPKVQVFEVEIEAKTPGSMKSVQTIAAELESNYPGFLRIWPHGKLVTGLAIQRLSKEGALRGYLQNGKLTPEAFGIIDRAIVAGKLMAPT